MGSKFNERKGLLTSTVFLVKWDVWSHGNIACRGGLQRQPQILSALISMFLCNVTLKLLHQDMGFVSPPLEFGLEHMTRRNWQTSVHVMQQRLVMSWLIESCPLAAFRTEPTCEEAWDKRHGTEMRRSSWVARPIRLLISRHRSEDFLDHPAPSQPQIHKRPQQILMKPSR